LLIPRIGSRWNRGVVKFAKPILTPKNDARLLTATMVGAGAAQVIQKNNVIIPERSHARCFCSEGAGFHYYVGYLKSLPAKLEHFRHERQLV